MRRILFYILVVPLATMCRPEQETNDPVAVILDTDTNNELDDQHALAYLLFNPGAFDVIGVTVNATRAGGDITSQREEARRIIELCDRDEVPLKSGANAGFGKIKDHVTEEGYDGQEAVDFIIDAAHRTDKGMLVLIAVGKLTNIALAVKKDPSIASMIRLVWLGSNYPDPGEYNLDNDIDALNYILDSAIPFEIVTVRYGKPSGTDAVRATQEEINRRMPGTGPGVEKAVTGRHGGEFHHFGDYSVNLFGHIHYDDYPPSRALFDMAAVAVVKDPTWAKRVEIPAPLYELGKWVDRPGNSHYISLWENFDKKHIISDFFEVMEGSGTGP